MDEGYNPSYGARPLRRAIMRLLEDSMAERMLAGDIKEGDSVIIDGERDAGVAREGGRGGFGCVGGRGSGLDSAVRVGVPLCPTATLCAEMVVVTSSLGQALC